jgi:hypothetical protein
MRMIMILRMMMMMMSLMKERLKMITTIAMTKMMRLMIII